MTVYIVFGEGHTHIPSGPSLHMPTTPYQTSTISCLVMCSTSDKCSRFSQSLGMSADWRDGVKGSI